jgi:hypothetical protein
LPGVAGVRNFLIPALPQRGMSVKREYNALRQDCQHFSAALRQKICN